jgi:type IV fimbrial biogenesis protein FimT
VKHLSRGFTLTEIIITGAIVIMMLSAFLPAYHSMSDRYKNEHTARDLHDFLIYAQQSASARGNSVSLCPASDNTFTQCGTDWRNGWILFDNPQNLSQPTPPVLRTYTLDTNTPVLFQITPAQTLITYTGNGFINPLHANTTFLLSTLPCQPGLAHSVVINASGALTVSNSACP